MKISPSILAADLIDLRSTLAAMSPADVDLIHMDVMDGHFVPALSFGELYTAAVKEATRIPLDVHLMVMRPEIEIPKYFPLMPYCITFHTEATHFPVRLAQLIRSQNIKCGVALNPGTPAQAIEPVLDEIDLVLVMSVEPGFYGQKFIPATTRKIEVLRGMLGKRPVEIEVDGGISASNIGMLKKAGVHICVAGAACFKGGSVADNVRALKAAAAAG